MKQRIQNTIENTLNSLGHKFTTYDSSGEITTDTERLSRVVLKHPESCVIEYDSESQRVFVRYGAGSERCASDIKDSLTTQLQQAGLLPVAVRVEIQSLERDREPREPVAESRMKGYRKTSYQDFGNGVRLVVRHRKEVDPETPGARSRSIRELVVKQGHDQYPMPFQDLAAGRAMATHCARGGSVDDEIGHRICQMASDSDALRSFVRLHRAADYSGDNHRDICSRARDAGRTIRDQIQAIIHDYDQAVCCIYEGDWDVDEQALHSRQDELMGCYRQSWVEPRAERAIPVLVRIECSVDHESRRPRTVPQDPIDAVMESTNRQTQIVNHLSRVAAVSPRFLRERLELVQARLKQGYLRPSDQRLLKNLLENARNS